MKNFTKIYLVSNIDNISNKVYIGKTKGSRETNHKKTYGKQIIYNIIDEVDSLEHKDWEPLETKWIQYYINLGYEVVNKRKKGGSGPNYQTDEAKNKQSLSMKGKLKPIGFGMLLSNLKKGIPNPKNKIKPEGFSERCKVPHKGGDNISKAKKGRPSGKKGKTYGELKEPHLKNINRKKPVIQIDPITNSIIKEWESRNKIKKEIGPGIVGAIRLKTKYKGYYWNYK